MMEWFKMQLTWGASISRLSDAEAGRFLKALYAYAREKKEYNGGGKEEFLVAQALETLRADVAKYEQQEALEQKRKLEKSEKCRQSALARWSKNNADGCERIDSYANRINRIETHANRMENKNKNILKDDDEDNARAHEDGPFGLTDADIHSALERDEAIESAARSVGLQVTEAGIMRGRELAEKYGLDALIQAIEKSVDAPKWAYVEGVLRNGGRDKDNRGSGGGSQADGGSRAGESQYGYLRSDIITG